MSASNAGSLSIPRAENRFRTSFPASPIAVMTAPSGASECGLMSGRLPPWSPLPGLQVIRPHRGYLAGDRWARTPPRARNRSPPSQGSDTPQRQNRAPAV